MNIFRKYSLYYDLFYEDKDYKKESGYIYNVLSKYYNNPANLLNLGCGTGNHDFNFVNFGLQITSIDSSGEAIEIAESKKREKKINADLIRFIQSDIRQINLNKKFNCAVALFHVINYLNSNEDLLNCLRSVSNHLEPGGIFAFDSWYGPAVLNDLPEVRTKKKKSGNLDVTRKAIPEMLVNDNIAKIEFNFEVSDTKNNYKEQFTETHSMRYFFMPELKLFLNETGFELIHTEEWMTGKPIGIDTWYILLVCKKI